MVRRGLVSSRGEAQEAVRSGAVTVSGAPATKAATLVAADAPVRIVGEARRFVSRGGEKLDAALRRFDLDPDGLDGLDAGASTGGFTDRLLQAGARRVAAVDVGYGQLAWSLRQDERVVVIERTNARDLSTGDLPFTPALVVADLSFISLRSVLPALALVSSAGADGAFLVKPQFEAGPADVGRGGVVRDPAVWARVLREVVEAAAAGGFAPQGLMASPLRGPAGNVEFLLWGRKGAASVELDVDAAVAEGREVAS
jgi:23S rRNA (cytidine1920-2'-O)/16S rRNA (cytidine1409-2'-O)-methyltransferase